MEWPEIVFTCKKSPATILKPPFGLALVGLTSGNCTGITWSLRFRLLTYWWTYGYCKIVERNSILYTKFLLETLKNEIPICLIFLKMISTYDSVLIFNNTFVQYKIAGDQHE